MDTIRFGLGVRALRRRRGWRQEDVAAAARMSKGSVARVERGGADRVTVATLDRIAAALDARLDCRLLWQGEALDRLLDADHASIVELVVKVLVADGWTCATEVTFNVYGERGSIDILAFHPDARIVLVIEVKSVVPDVGGSLMTLDRKCRHALTIARERGWPATSVARLLVIREDRTARRRVDAHEATFRVAFPTRGPAVKRWLAAPVPQPNFSGLWFLSPAHQAIPRQRVRRPRRSPERGAGPSS